jgi:predicted N-formylglutamate amidohydrolase
VPGAFKSLFVDQDKRLNSHHGYDRGALAVARKLSKRLSAPLIYSTTTRLLVDLNRSQHHPKLFSDLISACGEDIKQKITRRHYLPYHKKIDAFIMDGISQRKQTLHFSIHSFTPVLNNEVRNADIGLLYNPGRPTEVKLAGQLRDYIKTHSDYRVRMNYPYLGKADGLTTILRKRYPDNKYCGIEIEMNQALVDQNGNVSKVLVDLLVDGINEVLGKG